MASSNRTLQADLASFAKIVPTEHADLAHPSHSQFTPFQPTPHTNKHVSVHVYQSAQQHASTMAQALVHASPDAPPACSVTGPASVPDQLNVSAGHVRFTPASSPIKPHAPDHDVLLSGCCHSSPINQVQIAAGHAEFYDSSSSSPSAPEEKHHHAVITERVVHVSALPAEDPVTPSSSSSRSSSPTILAGLQTLKMDQPAHSSADQVHAI